MKRGALAHIRALGPALDGTLQDARRTVEARGRAVGRRARRLRAARSCCCAGCAATCRSCSRCRSSIPTARCSSAIRCRASTSARTASAATSATRCFERPGAPTVHLVVQARGRTGELMGVVVASLDLGFVRDDLLGARLGPGARLLVVDGTGVPVATSDSATASPSSLAGNDPAVDRALASTVEGTLSANGLVSAYRNLSSYQSLRGVRWAILHQQPEPDAYALARTTTRDTLVIGAAALALALALGAFFATRLTRPLADLARRADAIAAGQIVDEAADPRPRRDRHARALGRRDGQAHRRAHRARVGARARRPARVGRRDVGAGRARDQQPADDRARLREVLARGQARRPC